MLREAFKKFGEVKQGMFFIPWLILTSDPFTRSTIYAFTMQ